MKKVLIATLAAVGVLSISTTVLAQEKNEHSVKMNKMHKKMQDAHNKYWDITDADKDGKLSKAEVLAESSKNFDDRDVNHDGFLTKEELHEFYAKKIGSQYPQWHDRVEPENLSKKDLKQFTKNNEAIKKQIEQSSSNTTPTSLESVKTEDVYKKLTTDKNPHSTGYPQWHDRVEPEDVK